MLHQWGRIWIGLWTNITTETWWDTVRADFNSMSFCMLTFYMSISSLPVHKAAITEMACSLIHFNTPSSCFENLEFVCFLSQLPTLLISNIKFRAMFIFHVSFQATHSGIIFLSHKLHLSLKHSSSSIFSKLFWQVRKTMLTAHNQQTTNSWIKTLNWWQALTDHN